MNADQARMARAALKLGVREVAAEIGVTPNTISRIENGSDAKGSTLGAMRGFYERSGIKFLRGGDVALADGITFEKPGQAAGPGVAMKGGDE